MRAIILAAGRGLRLRQAEGQEFPKCLLRFAGETLLERHLRLLARIGVSEVTLAVGFRHELIDAELRRLGVRCEIVVNAQYELGSVLTVHTVAAALTRGGDVLLMDADVLYHPSILDALVSGPPPVNRLLIDRDFEAGDEPVKLCLHDGEPVELRKQLAPDLAYDTIGESVGFFRFDAAAARRLAHLVAGYISRGASDKPHEEAVRDLLLERSQSFEIADVSGMPWIEIDFPNDVTRAEQEILPEIEPRAGVSR